MGGKGQLLTAAPLRLVISAPSLWEEGIPISRDGGTNNLRPDAAGYANWVAVEVD